MKPIDENFHDDDDHRFDLLVDDELTERQRRELVAGLDDEPGGWRRCALAFLEAQSWKKDLAAKKGTGVFFRNGPKGGSHKRLPSPFLRRRVLVSAAMVACFFVALVLGLRLQDAWRSPGPRTRATATVPPNVVEPEAIEVPAPVSPSDAPSERWQIVTVAGPDGTSESIRLPAVERDRIDRQWLDGIPTAIPEDVLQALQRTGHQVRRHRELVPLPMQDGRRLVVPVDQVDVHYVGSVPL